MHTDKWCLEKGGGDSASRCIQNAGCCFDGRIGVCHSCDAHSDEWCDTYGGDEVKQCIGYAGCTFDSKKEKCISNSDPSSIVDEQTCEEAMTAALNYGKGGEGADGQSMINYTPQCTEDGQWEMEQYDSKSDFKWCVDENGHEIPDTRKKSKQFTSTLVNCDKERKKHAGQQCPNAVTLIAQDGEVMVNTDNPDVGNCDITCNTDQDCRGAQWCCYNGCGYSCQIPIIPKADCAHLPLDASLKATDLMTGEAPGVKHGTVVTISCAAGHSGSDPVQITCRHGSWDDYDMKCMEDCEPYRIPAGGRERDYVMKGDSSVTHGSKIKLRCVDGYGAVAGTNQVLLAEKETVECRNGAWDEQSLVCSACFDQGSSGPHGWWVGKYDNPPTKRGDSKDCKYFASRPLECAKEENKEAQEFCRISCKTCEQALMKYKVKAVKKVVGDDVRNPDKWIRQKLRHWKGFENWITEDRRTKVAKRVKKDN